MYILRFLKKIILIHVFIPVFYSTIYIPAQGAHARNRVDQLVLHSFKNVSCINPTVVYRNERHAPDKPLGNKFVYKEQI